MISAYAPPIYHDETIYSYVARLHMYRAETNHRVSAQRWFGKSPVNIDQRLPFGIQHLAESTGYLTNQLLYNHTFFPLFSGFVSRPDLLKQTMLSSSGYNLANVSAVAQAAMKQLGGSWYCPECIEQDRHTFGLAFWHLSHQMHGVISCPVHAINLRYLNTSSRKFYLPPQLDNTPRTIASKHAVRLTDLILRYSHDYQFFSYDCREDYWGGPVELVRLKKLLKGQSVDMTLLLPQANEISVSIFGFKLLTKSVVFNILHKSNYNCHPLKYIFLCYVLDQMRDKERSVQMSTKEETDKLLVDRERCIKLLNKRTYSLREISRRLKRSVNFVKSIANQIGIVFQKRTQFITSDVEAKILQSAHVGLHRKIIAEREGVSVGSVEILIQSVPGLSEKRKSIRMDKRRLSARESIFKAISAQSGITRKELKNLHYADYTWLYKHDNEWLYQILPPAKNYTKK
ncbi:TnsD family Tn7-like transposition protein [Pseudocolwellia sp. AS88]|uniref:TnsD family Tn7-like transposition protein n=1 Tax=Pseudocolwellia sp. AS88 TaxID=3063958 RepID=UPI0026EB0D28|nr:TnsD family Tn7-like transposition protein [Pseudocolwellia sp. AS88]MDO7084766.1 TnsD family Tn7-like transposition protein [Pseudocolwellia sp. AS88]